jgi:hypothetical protein
VITRGLTPQASEELMGVTQLGAARVRGGLRRTSRLLAADLFQLTHPCYGIKSDFELAELEADGAVTGTPVTTRLAK